MDPQDGGADRRYTRGESAKDGAAAGYGALRGGQPAGADREAAVVLAQVRWLLQDAADQVRQQAHAEGLSSAGHPLALGAELAACEAANLSPTTPIDDYGHECLPAGALHTLTAAETLTRSLPIDAFPTGMSRLVIRICGLIGEAAALLGAEDPDQSGDDRGAG